MSIYHDNIEEVTLLSENYRKVLHTTSNMQLVVMSIEPGQEIGSEVHAKNSQFIRVEKGKGRAVIGNEVFRLEKDDAVIVPPGTRHNIINVSDAEPLKLYTIYTPPVHEPSCVQRTKYVKGKETKEC